MADTIDVLRRLEVARAVWWRDAASGLEAILIIDDLTLGPAAGGVRTWRYPDIAAAVADATALARAMTIKCALAGLDAGGGKAVVLDHAGLDRRRAFAILGERIAELGGLFRTAGDLGTTSADLAAMASRCRYVHTDERALTAGVARGLAGCVAAALADRGLALPGSTVAIQGCGAIGAAVADALAAVGARLTIADLDPKRAAAVAARTGAMVMDPAAILEADVDVLAPCAIGGVITAAVAGRVRAPVLCGAANNVVANSAAAQVLHDRGIAVVPDVVASAGAVIDGVGATVMGLADRTALIDGLAVTARELLIAARTTGQTTRALAVARARERLAARRAARPPATDVA